MELRLTNVANQAEMNKTLRYQEDEHKSQKIRHWKPAQDFPRPKTTIVHP